MPTSVTGGHTGERLLSISDAVTLRGRRAQRSEKRAAAASAGSLVFRGRSPQRIGRSACGTGGRARGRRRNQAKTVINFLGSNKKEKEARKTETLQAHGHAARDSILKRVRDAFLIQVTVCIGDSGN